MLVQVSCYESNINGLKRKSNLHSQVAIAQLLILCKVYSHTYTKIECIPTVIS